MSNLFKKLNVLDNWANFLITIGVLITNSGFPQVGIPISLLANIFFLIFGIKTEYKSFIPTAIIMICLNIFGTINWLFFIK